MLKIEVMTRNMNAPDEAPTRKIIDHDNREDRVWLGKHCFWAFRNGRSVTTFAHNPSGNVPTKHPATIIRDLLEHAVNDRERNDECIAAVEDAEKWLAQQGEG